MPFSLLPPEMLVFFKPQIDYLAAHSVDPDKKKIFTRARRASSLHRP
jgi:hypothetical protein